jgi:hypothetical protein
MELCAVAVGARELHELRPSPASTRTTGVAQAREEERDREKKVVTWIPTCGSYYATYAKTTLKTIKSDGFHSS